MVGFYHFTAELQNNIFTISMWIYNLVVRCYGWFIKLASLRNQKAKFWVNGRENWHEKLRQKTDQLAAHETLWIHCASLGEFEQGRPIIEAIKRQQPQFKIVLSFFSPSGYEITKNYPLADVVTYLPLDTRNNAGLFLSAVNPSLIIFVRYEFWLNYLFEIKKRNIPCYLVSAVFKEHHPFFKWYGSVFIKSLSAFKTIFVQEEHSATMLRKINVTQVEVSGDTRNDRVLAIKEHPEPIPEIAYFKNNGELIAAGSTWPLDEDLVIKAFQLLKAESPQLKLLLAPHEIDRKSIETTTEKLKAANLSFSLFTEGVLPDTEVLVLNTMGMLSMAYQYANTAFVGGGMHTEGIHNILEPSVFFIPVSFGGKADCSKYPEALTLCSLGTACIVNSQDELVLFWRKSLYDQNYRSEVAKKLQQYFEKHGNITNQLLKSMNLFKKA